MERILLLIWAMWFIVIFLFANITINNKKETRHLVRALYSVVVSSIMAVVTGLPVLGLLSLILY